MEAYGTDEALAESIEEAKRNESEIRETVSELEARLSALNAGEIEEVVARTERAYELAREELQRVENELAGLDTALRSVQLHGLHGRLEEAREEVASAQRDVDRLQARAEAYKLLYETLTTCRSEVQQKFMSPLLDESKELLSRFFRAPEVTMKLNGDFRIMHLTRRGGGSFTFDLLSTGAQEQLALIVRLAMANLLAKEEPHPVFLDEALVDSDGARFDAMANVLRQVSRRVQVIVTSCHKRRYRRLGAERMIDLDSLKSVAA